MKKYLSMLFSSILLLCYSSCSNDIENKTINFNGIYTCRMFFEGEINQYVVTSRATTIAPYNGMSLHINFGNNIIGTAIYNSVAGEWSLTYTGSMTFKTASCSVFYVENEDSISDNVIVLKSDQKVCGTTDGEYTINSNGDITVKATLKPMLSRVRFLGTYGTQISVRGAKTLTALDLKTCTFTTTTDIADLTINSEGSTPYLYYLEPSTTNLVIVSNATQYSMANPLRAGGESGYIHLPTRDNHVGWEMVNVSNYEPVDLGLSVKWANMNVGATSPEEYGWYFAWGETEPTACSSWGSYKWWRSSDLKLTKYCTDPNYGIVDNKTTLDPDDDAAHVNCGGLWRMPTEEELNELCLNCTCAISLLNGVAGYMVVSMINGNSIFLPITSNSYYGTGCWCWSSTLDTSAPRCARQLSCVLFENDEQPTIIKTSWRRCIGFPVRPVCP